MAKRKTVARPKGAARKSTKTASRKTKSSGKSHAAADTRRVGDQEVTIDRRHPAGRRNEAETSSAPGSGAVPTGLERRKKVNRRRQIDPTTCERDYTDDEIEFMNALEHYKRASGRMFPTCSEVLEVVRSLGYVRRSPSEQAAEAANEPAAVVVATALVEQPEAALVGEWQ